jgi:hypothetical protein
MSWLLVLLAWTLLSLIASPMIGGLLADGHTLQPRDDAYPALNQPTTASARTA